MKPDEPTEKTPSSEELFVTGVLKKASVVAWDYN
jgi:hypothetical protein